MGGNRKTAIFVALVLVLGFGISSAAQARTCGLVKYASFDISGHDGAAVIPASLNGTEEEFLVDTGALYSTLAEPLLKPLGLQTRNVTDHLEIYAADGSMIDGYARVKKFKVGPVVIQDANLLVMPGDWHAGDIAGTVGPDVLRNFDVDFDFGGNSLNLFSQDHCEGQVVYWARAYGKVPFKLYDGKIKVIVEMDGHHFDAIIDTGTDHSVISAIIARRAFGLSDDSPGMKPVKDASEDALVQRIYTFKTLTVGDVAVKNPRMGILQDEAKRAFRKRHGSLIDRDPEYGVELKTPQIILGRNVLRKLHLYIAYKEHMIYVAAAGTGHEADTPSDAASAGTGMQDSSTDD